MSPFRCPERGTHRWPAACVMSTGRGAEESVTEVSTSAVTVSAQAGRGFGPHPGATCATGMRRAGGGFRKLLQMPGRLRGSVGSRPPFAVIHRPLRPVPISRSFPPPSFRARLPPTASVTPGLWAPRPGRHRPAPETVFSQVLALLESVTLFARGFDHFLETLGFVAYNRVWSADENRSPG